MSESPSYIAPYHASALAPTLRLFLFLFLIAIGSTAPAIAEQRIRIETVPSSTPNGKPAAALLVNGEVTVRIAKEQFTLNPMRSISIASAMLTSAYRAGRIEFEIRRGDERGRRFLLFLNDNLFLAATDMEGKAWGASPADLADSWKYNLEVALGISKSAADQLPTAPEFIQQVDPGAAGNPDGLLQVSSAVFTTKPGKTPVNPTLTPRPAGATGLLRAKQSYSPGELRAVVTGNASAEDCWLAIEAVLRAQVKSEAGAALTWNITGQQTGLKAPAANLTQNLAISYSTGQTPGAESSSSLPVVLAHETLDTPRESFTFFSNNPEGITEPRLLYQADLPGLESARLVYHHQNQGRGSLDYTVTLYNPSDSTAVVHVVTGAGEPDINTFYVGFRSAERFWAKMSADSGAVVVVRPHGQITIMRQTLSRGYTSSGYMKLSNLGNSAVRVMTNAVQPGTRTVPLQIMQPDYAFPVYSSPYVTADHDYSPAGPWLHMRIGDKQAELSGNSPTGLYGYTHEFRVRLKNSHRYPELVFVLLKASAGEVKGQVFIDGEYIVTPLVDSGAEVLLREIPLAPGQERDLLIQAIPLNGGFYPASIIVRNTRLP